MLPGDGSSLSWTHHLSRRASALSGLEQTDQQVREAISRANRRGDAEQKLLRPVGDLRPTGLVNLCPSCFVVLRSCPYRSTA